ncbi:hypothetical protein OKHIL_17000 [Mycolicibacterium mageritense]
MTTPNPKRERQPDPFDALLAGVREFAHATDEETGREVLTAAVKQYLAELPDDEFAALIEEVREPTAPGKPAKADESYPAAWGFQPKRAD